MTISRAKIRRESGATSSPKSLTPCRRKPDSQTSLCRLARRRAARRSRDGEAETQERKQQCGPGDPSGGATAGVLTSERGHRGRAFRALLTCPLDALSVGVSLIGGPHEAIARLRVRRHERKLHEPLRREGPGPHRADYALRGFREH